MKKTLVINLFGAPGTGKSTICAELFAKLKWEGIDCEMVTEYAKDIVWEESLKKFESQIYIFGKQYHRLRRVYGKVDIIITDAPLLNFLLFVPESSSLTKTIKEAHEELWNLNILLKRTKPYNPNGRTQTKEESDQVATKLDEILSLHLKPYSLAYFKAEQNSTSDAILKIIRKLKE